METLFGPGGKLVGWLAAADEHTIVMGYVNKESLQRAIEDLKQGKPGLAADADVSKTAILLPPDALATGYLSPQGTINFIKRIAAIAAPGAEVVERIPEFPKTPPLGFAVRTAPNELQTWLVVPSGLLQAIAPYVGKIQAMRSGVIFRD
jgi:hypothetical protein